MDNFDDTFESFGDDDNEEELYDTVEQSHTATNYDPVTKEKVFHNL